MPADHSASIWRPALVAAGGALLVSGLGGAATEIGPWYAALNKPSWQPPNWLFGPVWSTIFILCAIAGVVAWRAAATPQQRRRVLVLFGINGILNVLWSVLFFHLHRPDWALMEIGVLWLSILALIVGFWSFARVASLLLVPYIAWVSFAIVLNTMIVRLN